MKQTQNAIGSFLLWLTQLKEQFIIPTGIMEAVAPLIEPLRGKVCEVVAIDVSGSMERKDYRPSRLGGAKKAARGFLNRVHETAPDTVVAIVSFESHASVVRQPAQIGENLSSFNRAVDAMRAGATTNTAGGLRLAAKQIARVPDARRPRILLLTDGHANTGGNPKSVAWQIKEQGIQLDIIGIGGSPSDVNEKQLRAMASVVDGETRYWFIRSVGELVRKFEALALREVK